MKNMWKKLFVALFVFALALTGMNLLSTGENEVYAAEETEEDVKYYVQTYTGEKVKEYKDAETAPVPTPSAENAKANDWIFAGWFTDDKCETALGTTINDGDTYYAKFVPSEVLSVKAQVKNGTTAETDKTDIRLVATVDSLNYKSVGFEVYYNNATTPIKIKSTTVYSRIEAAKDGVDYGFSPNIFDTQSEYFVTATLKNVANKNFGNSFYIRPYWETLDGTTVYGVSRYAQVADSYNNIVNVPVRLVSDSATATTGTVKVTGYETNFTYVDAYEKSVFDSIAIDTTTEANTVIITGTSESAAKVSGEIAHLRFQMKNATLPKNNVFTVTSTDLTENIVVADSVYKYFGIAAAYSGTPDESWYNPDETEFVLTTAEELYGLASLVDSGKLFEEKTVYLGADITVNDGKATEWAEGTNTSELYPWKSIGDYLGHTNYTKTFYGVFDGQGHTISGLYANEVCGSATTFDDRWGVGLFAKVGSGATIRDLKLVNSYMQGSYRMGAIVGQDLGATIDSVYTDAIVKCYQMGGGIVGVLGGTVNNCWFDGKISGTTYIGGFTSYSGAGASISNCLNAGEVKASSQEAGGLVGRVAGNTSIQSCLSNGTVTGTESGSIIGEVNSGTVTASKVYATTSANAKTVGKGTISSGVEIVEDLNDYNGYVNTELDFENYWVLRQNATPVLKSWVESGALYVPKTDWSGSGTGKDPYVIKTPEQLYGLANSVNDGTTYEGKFFKLGANITVNSGTASRWDTEAPKYNWIPIGAKTKPFKGIFDGANHTIKGLYAVSSTPTGLFVDPDAITVKNLKLTNSYLEGGEGSAAIAGWNAGGTFENIYTDAIVVTKNHGAGIAALVNEANTKITNCWFDGELIGKKYVGGLASYISVTGVEISNCLVTAPITSTHVADSNGTRSYAGGLLGDANVKLTMTNCLVGDDIAVTGTDGMTYIGSIAGRVGTTSTISNVYAETSVSSKTANDGNLASIIKVDDLTGANGYKNTYLTFDRHESHLPASEQHDGVWVARSGKAPGLKQFVDKDDVLQLVKQDTYRPDMRWYNETDTVFTINNAEEFVGFMQLVNNGTSFAGKTVQLGADIELNIGQASDWYAGKNETNLYNLIPIGNDGKKFTGTFDGKGHTISGVYGDHPSAGQIGLFGQVADGSVVRDFKLINSYFYSGKSNGAAAICGWYGGGTFDTIYTDAYVHGVGQHIAGMVAVVNAGTTIKNCWFAGTMKAGNSFSGGIVSFIAAANVSVESCLNTGSLTGTSEIGGIVGRSAIDTNIKDSLSVGTIKSTTGSERKGAIVGWPHAGILTCENVYGLGKDADLFVTKAGSTNAGGSVAGTYAGVADLTGANGFLNTWLNFDRPELPTPITGKWVAVTGGTPVLKSFVDLAGVERLTLNGQSMYRTDTRWYDESKTKFTITTAEQLIGFASLVNGGEPFAGKTVTLGANITINDWDAKDYNNAEVTATLYNGPVIGDYGWHSDFAVSFAGTFDGAGYDVSGIYANKTGYDAPSSSEIVAPSNWCAGLFGRTYGATVQNVNVLNSYFYAANYAGGIVADSNITIIRNVYTDAIVQTTASVAGGIAGRQVSGEVSNAWFNGSAINAGQFTAGIVGVSSISGETAPSIANCLVTGSVISTKTSNHASTAGILGETQSNISIAKCLVDAKEISVKNKYSAGSVIGCVGANKTVTSSALYVVDGNCSDLITATVGKHATNAAGAVSTAPVVSEDFDNYKGYMNTDLDFDNIWVAMEETSPVLQIFAPEEGRFDTTSWFTKAGEGVGTTEENPYIIDSLADLYGFTKRVKDGNTFENSYIKLTQSIVANTVEDENTVAGWATEVPYYVWSPVGGNPNAFKGHFDGGMNTISGLYATGSYGTKNPTWYTGLFGYIDGATVKNVKVEDSYFEAAYYTAGVVGCVNAGTVDSVYSNATTVATTGNAATIAGVIYNGTIQNSWADGNATAPKYAGGITSFVSTGTVTIQHCLNTGEVNATTEQAGGIVGRGASTMLTIHDCLNVGTVISPKNHGTVLGYMPASGYTTTITQSYGYSDSTVQNSATKAVGNVATGSTATGGTKITDLALVYDAEAYERLNAGFWAARVGNYPIPSVFVTDADYAKPATKDAFYVGDTTFEQDGTGAYLISSAAELYGLASLSQTDSFEGKTFKLTNTIIINHQTLDVNTTEATSYEWLPIGGQSKPFKGTFNGDGHTISGLYKNFDVTYDSKRWTGLFDTIEGGTVENLNIANTYFTYVYNGKNADPSRIGSVAGYGGGTFRNISSTASLINDGRGTGGIIGQTTTDTTISNCWFGGEAVCETTTQSSYLGGLIGFATAGGNVIIEHSHVNGDVLGGSYHVGGLVGNIQGAVQATITDSMFNGNFKASDDKSGDVFKHAQLVGTVVANEASATGGKASSLKVSNCYGVNNFASYDIGALTSYTHTDETVYTPTVTGSGNVSVKADRLVGYAGNTASLDYNTYWVLTNNGTPMLKTFVAAENIYDGSQLTGIFKLDTVGKTLADAEEVGGGRYTIKLTGKTKDDYTAYCNALDAGVFDAYGNDQSSDLNAEGVYNMIYTSAACGDTANDDWVVNVTFLQKSGVLTITVSSVDKLSQHLKADSIEAYSATDGYTTSGLTPTFHMIEQKTQKPAASYVIQLSNGHFVVIDGGFKAEAPYLMEYLESLVPEGTKPIVEAWIISHAHQDHIETLELFVTQATTYQGKLYLEGIYYSEASDKVMSTVNSGKEDGHHHYSAYINRIGSVFQTTTGNEPQVYRMYTGQRYTFDTVDKVVMDVMLATEQFAWSDYQRAENVTNPSVFNETSTWTMFTINGKKLLTAGDSNYIGKEFVVNNYSTAYLTVDIFTALHHGENINREQSKQGGILTEPYTNNDNFSNAISVKGAVLYSYPIHWDDEQTKTTITARVNSFMKLQRQKGMSGIATTYESGSTGSKNPEDYFYHGQGTVVLTFGDDNITANVKAHNDWVNDYAPTTTTE